MYMYQNMRMGQRFQIPKEFESKNFQAANLYYILSNSGHEFWDRYDYFDKMAIGDENENLS